MPAAESPTPATRHLFVTGGSGFIGSQVCRLASENGWKVTSLSRSGRPNLEGAWVDDVTWVAADLFNTSAWKHRAADCDALVHCVGIAWEKPEANITFERMNGDSAIAAADVAHEMGIRRLLMVSAATPIPFVSPRYLSEKRRAESHLRSLPLHSAILRPGLVYGPARSISIVGGKLQQVAQKLPVFGAFAKEAGSPLHVHQLAAACVYLAGRPEETGIFGVRDIEALADRFDPNLDLAEAATQKVMLVTGALVGLGIGLWLASRSRNS